MIEVKDNGKEKMLAFLASKGYITLNLRGVIRNTDKSVYTDDLEDPKGVFVRDQYMTFIYAENQAFVEAFDKFIDDETFVGFSGTNAIVKDYYFNRVLIQWDNPCHQMHYDGEGFERMTGLESLKLEDASFIDDHYEYQNENSLTQIQVAIEERPSSGLRLDGQLVSYVLLHQDDSIGYMYTLPDYRGRGYAYELTKDIVNKTMASGRLPYVQIVHGNDKSIGLAKKAGFIGHGDVYWFGIVRSSGNDMVEMIHHYQSLFQEAPQAYTCKEICKKTMGESDVQVVDEGFLYKGMLYPVRWHFKEGVYYVHGDMPHEVMLAGTAELMTEDWHLAFVNQPIVHSAYKALKKLD